MTREARRHSAPPKVAISSSLALLLFLGALDLHSPSLVATIATTTPVLATNADPSLPAHIEPVGALLAPDHPPALLKVLKNLDRPRSSPSEVIQRPKLSGALVIPKAPRLAESPLERRTPSRGPPLSPSI